MGKGFNNFMSKKAFHPGSHANQRRIHEAEEKAEAKRKHDEDTLAQYQKEQELFNQRSLVSKESREKLSLNFMYEAPPGVEKPDSKRADKLEWKGTGAGAGGSSRQSASSNGDKSAPATICLEWRRDKPVRGSAQERAAAAKETKAPPTVKLEVKHEPTDDKSGPLSKGHTVKREHDADLKAKRIKTER